MQGCCIREWALELSRGPLIDPPAATQYNVKRKPERTHLLERHDFLVVLMQHTRWPGLSAAVPQHGVPQIHMSLDFWAAHPQIPLPASPKSALRSLDKAFESNVPPRVYAPVVCITSGK